METMDNERIFEFGENDTGKDQWYAKKDGVRIKCDEKLFMLLWWRWVSDPTAKQRREGDYDIRSVGGEGIII